MLRTRSNKRACWKCGQQVEHYKLLSLYPSRYYIPRSGKKHVWRLPHQDQPMVAVRHLAEKSKHWQWCKGLCTPGRVCM